MQFFWVNISHVLQLCISPWGLVSVSLILLVGYMGYRWRVRKLAMSVDHDHEIKSKGGRPSYSEGEVSAQLFQPNFVLDRERALPPVSQSAVSVLLTCEITKRQIKKPVVVSCGKIFDANALRGYLQDQKNIRSDFRLGYTPPPDREPFFVNDTQVGTAGRAHYVLSQLFKWLLKQPRHVQNLVKVNPEFFFVEIDNTPRLDNLVYLMSNKTCPEGFLQSWYDPGLFFHDPVIDADGHTVELPARYAQYCKNHRYNDLVFCAPGGADVPSTVLDRLIWVRPRDGSGEVAILSNCLGGGVRDSDEVDSVGMLRLFYQDRFVDTMIDKVKPLLDQYARTEGLVPPLSSV